MAAIGGNTLKFLQVNTPAEGTTASVRIDVLNPHLVGIGEVVVEIRDGKLQVTRRCPARPSSSSILATPNDPVMRVRAEQRHQPGPPRVRGEKPAARPRST